MTRWRRALALGLVLVPLMLAGCAAATSGASTNGSASGGAANGQTTHTTGQQGTGQVSAPRPTAAVQVSTQGTISGSVVAGPTCPVQTAEDPCPPKPVPGRPVSIQTPNGTEVASTVTDASGNFTVHLAAGSYVVRVVTGVGLLGLEQVTPGDVTVVAGQTTHIQIELDTGIR
jgi:hypothetical protein